MSARASNPALPKQIEEMRSRVFVNEKNVAHTVDITDPKAFEALDYDNSFNLEDFKSTFRVDIIEKDDEKIVFDLVGISAPLANAFRRIMISDVPTMAIETVRIFQNTSLIQDEVLAHRLGLIPIKANPRKFKFLSEAENVPNEDNTTVFTLQIKCSRNAKAGKDGPELSQYINPVVYSNQLTWVPQGLQQETFEKDPIGVVHDDIIVAKLRPGQEIEAELHVIKGVGRDHAKWSPVATASYRMLPDVIIENPIMDEKAEALVAKCPMDVFDIEDLADDGSKGSNKGKGSKKSGRKQAVVARPRNCSMCRECIREPEWADKVKLRRVRDHFIFSVETTGAYKPEEIFQEALNIFSSKCSLLKSKIK